LFSEKKRIGFHLKSVFDQVF